MDDFGKRLKELRARSQLSQNALAKKLGVTPQAVSKWEKGISTPDLSVIVPMAKLFRVSTDQLLGYEGIRSDWELRWQLAMQAGDPAEARRVAVEAQQELPQPRHFSYRQAQAEAMMAGKTEDPEEKKRLLFSAEQRLRDILNEYPEFESAALSLVSVLLRQGRRQEAENIARGYPQGLYILVQLLGKEASEEMRQRVITGRAMQFLSTLMEDASSLSALDLAERFVEIAPWDTADKAGYLSMILVKRACLLCAGGDGDGAMAALERMRSLMHPVEARPAEEKGSLTFLRALGDRMPSEDWVFGLELLRDPRLKPLEGREEFQVLLALAEKRSPAGKA